MEHLKENIVFWWKFLWRPKIIILDRPELGGSMMKILGFHPGEKVELKLPGDRTMKAVYNDGYVVQMLVNSLNGFSRLLAREHMTCRDEGCQMVEMATDILHSLDELSRKYEARNAEENNKPSVEVPEGTPGG